MIQETSSRHLAFLTHVGAQAGGRGEKRGMTHLSILHQLLNFLQKGCTALKRSRILSLVTRILLISVWLADLFAGETHGLVCCFGVYLSTALSPPKQRSSAEVTLPSVSPWHGLTGGCAL